jgi:hypothetical protein
LFQADGDGTRRPSWITESNLGRIRANNYVTIFLDVYDPPSLAAGDPFLYKTVKMVLPLPAE